MIASVSCVVTALYVIVVGELGFTVKAPPLVHDAVNAPAAHVSRAVSVSSAVVVATPSNPLPLSATPLHCTAQFIDAPDAGNTPTLAVMRISSGALFAPSTPARRICCVVNPNDSVVAFAFVPRLSEVAGTHVVTPVGSRVVYPACHVCKSSTVPTEWATLKRTAI